MEKKLPNVFANPINKQIDNVQELYYGKDSKDDRNDSKSVLKKINQIFNSGNFVYKSRVRITTNSAILEKVIVGKTNLSLLTMDNETIPITTILDIEQI